MTVQADQDRPILIPFLKWAGGKRWLTSQYSNLLPSTFERYLEPFLGSAAVYFHLQPHSAILADRNAALINTYKQIRLNWEKVQRALRRHHRDHSERYYYAERARRHRAPHEQAAQFIYLNRTCWNGLYRVNLRGEFNVPIGTKTTVCLDTDDFASAASILKKAELLTADFESIIEKARNDDFVFVDPPYITRHNFNGFVKYNDKIFSWSDQLRLARTIRDAAERGAKILVTNADHRSVHELYQGMGQKVRVERHSVLAADSDNRGITTELAIAINYKVGAR
jgi:DNA adenine methylase